MDRLGEIPQELPAVAAGTSKPITVPAWQPKPVSKRLVGVDVFLDWSGETGQNGTRPRNPEHLAEALLTAAGRSLKLKMITNRGVKVWPEGYPETFCTDHWRCRFVSPESQLTASGSSMAQAATVSFQDVLALQSRLDAAGISVIKTENLYEINGERAYTLGQGE
jgi:isocitrate dehydrogenase